MNASKSKNIAGPTDLRLTGFSFEEGRLVARIEGTLDASTASDLDERFKSLLQTTPAGFLVDLGGVDYLSSMGLSILFKTVIRLKNNSVPCWFYDPQLSVRRVLQISKWDHLIIDAAAIKANHPFFGYVCEQEPLRASRRSQSSAPPPRLIND